MVQLTVWDEVAGGVPSVAGGYEDGFFYLDGAQCQPGENQVLHGSYGSIDCATSSVTRSGEY